MRKCFILGSNGFLGRNLINHPDDNLLSIGVDSKQINFLKPESFSSIPFSNETIIDCINVNNGIAEDIINCNVIGFRLFIDYLKQYNFSGKYVYISTISVLDDAALKASVYVKSKKEAEDYLKRSGLDYQIIRISYPFGEKENPQRLIPRLKKQIENNEPVRIHNIKINLNFIKDVVRTIFDSIGKNREMFISNNKYVSLGDLAERMKHKLLSNSTIEIMPATTSFMPLSETPYICEYNVLDKLEETLT